MSKSEHPFMECERTQLKAAWCIIELNNFFAFLAEHGNCFVYNKSTKFDSLPMTISSSSASGIGRTLYIKCNNCNVEKDITDYSCW